jgi:hypothetical protein
MSQSTPHNNAQAAANMKTTQESTSTTTFATSQAHSTAAASKHIETELIAT